jgi:hypothetical protein
MWNQQEKMLSAEKMVMSKMIKTSFWLITEASIDCHPIAKSL